MNKKKILCIVGKSGSGKTTCATMIEALYDIPMINSYTDRPKREPNETGHIFLTPNEFDKINPKDMIAYTKFGEYRYCCIHDDLKQENTYVIDETGLDYLQANFKDMYHITSVYVDRNDKLKNISQERMDRDNKMFYKTFKDYDYLIDNNGTKEYLQFQLEAIIEKVFFGKE